MRDEIDLSYELSFEVLCSAVFVRQLIEEGRSWVTVSEWTSDETSFLDRLDHMAGVEPVITKNEASFAASVFYLGGCLVLLQVSLGHVLLRVAGDEQDAREVEARVKEILPQADEHARVRLTFWYWSNMNGVAKRTRRVLRVPRWGEISENYPLKTRQALDHLIAQGVERGAGQLLLWFGDPGSGKTYAIRSLLREWKDRFSLHYISDPERFFGNSDYMLPVLLDGEESRDKLLVIEDAGEFLLPDARQQMGQGLSRLLNASDGLLGQGLNSMFLITTNEELARLHPAISRPGRCAAQIAFDAFSVDEAKDWLRRKRVDSVESHGNVRLAELFALLANRETRSNRVTIGFR